MKNTCFKFSLLAFLLCVAYSCNKDDGGEDYVPLTITTEPDVVTVLLTATVDISIFSNDDNIPQDGVLSISAPQSGNAEIDNQGTANSVLDDVVRYTPNPTFSPSDSFQYTICDANGENCKTETVTIEVTPVSIVNVDLSQVPYATLSEYQFFTGNIADQNPGYSVLPYAPISSLFTDYAKKSRFVWMPSGVMAEYTSDDQVFDFPTGSVLIKSFYYDDVQPAGKTQIIETRLMIKQSTGWTFADYIWNEAQTEALLETTGDGGQVAIEWLQNGQSQTVNYRIPATSQCIICHKNNFVNLPIGVKPQSLNGDYQYADGTFNQLQKWIEMGYLKNDLPTNITTVVDWEDTTKPLQLRARSYIDVNCGSCHIEGGHGDYRAIRLGFNDTDGNDTNLGICIDPDTEVPGYEGDKLIAPGDAQNSVLYYRMITSDEQYRMPQFGRSLRHDESAALMEEWINSLTQTCN